MTDPSPGGAALPANAGHWHRRVWRIAGPIILSNVSVPLLGAVDTAVMGHLPDPGYIGGVAVGAMVFSFLYWGFGFLRMGTSGFTAQALGGGDEGELRATFARAVLLGAGFGLLLVLLQGAIGALAFPLVEASETVTGFARRYFEIRIWGAPATLILYAVLGWLLGTQNARGVLLLQLVQNGLNIGLNLFFVLGLGMTIEGVALATLIAEYTALALGLFMVLLAQRGMAGRLARAQLLRADRLVALLRVNADIFLRTLTLIFAFSSFTTLGARLGDVTLAGNAVLMTLMQVTAYGLDGFAHAAEVLAGAAYGAGDRAAFRAAVRAATLWALGLSLLLTALLLLFGAPLIAVFTDLPEVRAAAAEFLPWLAAMPLVGVWAYQFDGIFIGATRTAAMRNAMLVSLAVYLAALWLLLPAWGNHGLWAALAIFMAMRGITLGFSYPALLRAVGGRPAPQKERPAGR